MVHIIDKITRLENCVQVIIDGKEYSIGMEGIKSLESFKGMIAEQVDNASVDHTLLFIDIKALVGEDVDTFTKRQ